MGLGKVIKFFHRPAQSHAEEFPAAESDQGVRKLIGLPEHVFLAPGIEVGKHAREPPGRHVDHEADESDDDRTHRKEDVHGEAAQKEHPHDFRRNHCRCAEVGLLHQKKGNDDHRERNRRKAPREGVHEFLTLHRKGGGKNERPHLHELRRLNREACDLNPAPRAVDAFAHNRQKNGAKEEDA